MTPTKVINLTKSYKITFEFYTLSHIIRWYFFHQTSYIRKDNWTLRRTIAKIERSIGRVRTAYFQLAEILSTLWELLPSQIASDEDQANSWSKRVRQPMLRSNILNFMSVQDMLSKLIIIHPTSSFMHIWSIFHVKNSHVLVTMATYQWTKSATKCYYWK